MPLGSSNHKVALNRQIPRTTYLKTSTYEMGMGIDESRSHKFTLQVHNFCVTTNGQDLHSLKEKERWWKNKNSVSKNSAKQEIEHNELRLVALYMFFSSAPRENRQGSKFDRWRLPWNAPRAASHPRSILWHSQTTHQQPDLPSNPSFSWKISPARGKSLIPLNPPSQFKFRPISWRIRPKRRTNPFTPKDPPDYGDSYDANANDILGQISKM